MSKRATKIYVEYHRAARIAIVALAAAILSACSSSDYGRGPEASAVSQPAAASPNAATTGADGYPNINVDTAGHSKAPVKTVEERGRLESELMALGARQKATEGAPPQSVVQELQDLGRRAKADAEKQIESGTPPEQ